jgi:predicted ribosomally synthesized peptide with SipW-like signal peptide
MKRILLSLMMIATVAGFGFLASRAYFSDTETSTGNVFAAGAIDLLIDNESYVTDVNGQLVASPQTSWTLDNLSGRLFFNFQDLKPGDIGEDTISIHVKNNDAWLCAAARITQDSDVDYTEPELDDDPTKNELDPLNTDGELAENLTFAFWADDGDNVYEEGEEIFLQGPLSQLGTAGGVITLADSQKNIWNSQGGSIKGEETFYVGKAWCFGDLTPDAVQQDKEGKTQGSINGPLVRGTGFICSGAPATNNAAQTDRVMGDLQFYAVQSRNNADFTCSQNYTPVWPTPTVGAPTNTPTPTPTNTPGA